MMHRKHILRTVSKIIAPFILLFALYVQFHGDYGPGGGFQAGVIFASVFILYALIYGMDNARRVLPLTFAGFFWASAFSSMPEPGLSGC